MDGGGDDDEADNSSMEACEKRDDWGFLCDSSVFNDIRQVSGAAHMPLIGTVVGTSFHLGVVVEGIFSKKSLDKISSISCRQLLTS